LDEEHVVVDFNHPLAGRELIFEVEILQVFDADAQPVSLQPSGAGHAH
ncbi:MAG: peptidylprolyl isomerase, partial [Pseudomonadales bacterium]|nr:peptidylprolyl isomerase [Pseudomonadales bacterium]